MQTQQTKLVAPVVNLNGTSRNELQYQCMHAWHALFDALKAVKEMTPHGRDYQTAGQEVYLAARDQHEERIRKLESVQNEVYEIWEYLQEEPIKSSTLVAFAARKPPKRHDDGI